MLACFLPTGTTVLGHSCASDFDTFSLHSTTLKSFKTLASLTAGPSAKRNIRPWAKAMMHDKERAFQLGWGFHDSSEGSLLMSEAVCQLFF